MWAESDIYSEQVLETAPSSSFSSSSSFSPTARLAGRVWSVQTQLGSSVSAGREREREIPYLSRRRKRKEEYVWR